MPQDEDVQGQRVPAGDDPGAGSTPADEGEGVVDVESRTSGGAPAANQSKVEPFPPAASHDEPTPVAAPDLESMNVGANDPQAPSHGSAGPAGDRAAAGMPPSGPPVPASGVAEPGSAFRAPGSLGAGADDEQIETDPDASARALAVDRSAPAAGAAGDAASVPVVAEHASPGTSEASAKTQGARTPR